MIISTSSCDVVVSVVLVVHVTCVQSGQRWPGTETLFRPVFLVSVAPLSRILSRTPGGGDIVNIGELFFSFYDFFMIFLWFH